MKEHLMEQTKLAAYFLWEYTEFDNALHHWYCAEDIACFLEENCLLTEEALYEILHKDKIDCSYIAFVRHIAFRIYVYTRQEQALNNWFAAERLLSNREWLTAVIAMGNIYHAEKDTEGFIMSLRSSKARNYYEQKRLI